jgi:nucleoside-diphosphate-sugar epimerase
MYKICLTGATGFIGNFFLNNLKKNFEVFVIKKKLYKRNLITGRNIKNLANFFKKKKIKLVINVASFYSLDERIYGGGGGKLSSNLDNFCKLYNANYKFGVDLLAACNESNVKYFINISTKMTSYKKIILYAFIKKQFEDFLKYFSSQNKIKYLNIKIPNIIGKEDRRDKLFNLLKKLKNNSSIKMTNGRQKIEILHIDDVMQVVLRAINLLRSGKYYNKTYYLNSKYIVSVKIFCLICCRLMNKKIHFKWSAFKNRTNDYFNSKLFQPSFPNFKQVHDLKTSILRSL